MYPDILLAAQLISLVPLFPLNATELRNPPDQEKKNLSNSIFSETQTGCANVYMEASGFITANIPSDKSKKMTFVHHKAGSALCRLPSQGLQPLFMSSHNSAALMRREGIYSANVSGKFELYLSEVGQSH